MSVPTQFIDVDLSQPPADQLTGLMPQSEEEVLLGAGEIVGSFASEYPQLMVPRSQRKEIAARKWPQQRATVRQIYSQGRTSACVGFGAAQALETTRTRRYGAPHHVSLSGMSVYKEIGATLMSGAYISDGMKQIVKTGVLPLDTPENRERFSLVWGLQDWSSRFPAGWTSHAQHFRVAKWAVARGADEIESALLNDLCGIVGRQQHCVPYVGLTYDGNAPYVPYANSWSSSWGDRGFGYDSRRIYDSLSLYLILEVVVDNQLHIPR